MSKDARNIIVYIVEEHHEAFSVWHNAIINGILPPINNTLLHIDEHSDMDVSKFNTSLNELSDIDNFVRNELTIGSFILPAIYRGIFNKVYWIRCLNGKTRSNTMYVRTYNKDGRKLVYGKKSTVIRYNIPDDIRFFLYKCTTIENIPRNKNIVLDIDLDYFSCTGNPNELVETKIEITKDEFERFDSDKYHRINYLGVKKVEVESVNNKYYYVFNRYNYIYQCGLKVDLETIIKRVNSFEESLIKNNIKPSLITICRSRFSGYTPLDQWELIEKNILERLSNIYNLKIVYVT